jgi:hypothetical protein
MDEETEAGSGQCLLLKRKTRDRIRRPL